MQRVTTAAEFLDAPAGRYVQGRTYVYWCFDAALWGLSAWGHPREEDLVSLIDVFHQEHLRVVPPYASLVDFSRLEAIDPGAFRLWGNYVAENRKLQEKKILREAIVRPSDGLVASALAGYANVVDPLHPLRVFTEVDSALDWIGRDDAPHVVDWLDELVSGAVGGDVVARLRELFTQKMFPVEDAARRLGMSARSLQRALRAAGTSYQKESQAERVRLAKQLLLETDAKLSSIAHESGFSNQQHFTRIFTQIVGAPPGAWRIDARKRPAPAR